MIEARQKCEQEGLYQSTYEHDACGVGMLVNIRGEKSHELVEGALCVLENMRHRGAEGADKKTGDGAGILVQVPHEFILLQGIPVPEKGRYGVGMIFLPKEVATQREILDIVAQEAERQGLRLMHVRNVPTNSDCLGHDAHATEPAIFQLFITAQRSREPLEHALYLLRKQVEQRVTHPDFYIVSLSSQRLIYKGMLSSLQLREYYPDLSDANFTSAICLVHSRFSTNTFPTWSLAQPFRLLAHNGEINTIRGNRAWMEARESVLTSERIADTRELRPLLQSGMSDSASLDNVLEFLVESGLSLPHAMSMLIPESFNDKNPISTDLKAFYEYHSLLMEPWDGPAALLFSDGRYAGAMLDRNGLRPARYLITQKDTLLVASEAGVLQLPVEDIVEKGILQPGKLLLVDTHEGRILRDGEIKQDLATKYPYRRWLEEGRIELDKLRSGRHVKNTVSNYEQFLRLFDFTQEDLERTLLPMAEQGNEPTISMGNDTPLAVLSQRPQLLFNYFRQQFAQVTNPPIDPIREQLVMSLTEYIGATGEQLLTPSKAHCKMVRLTQPILTNTQLDILCHIRYKGFTTVKLSILFEAQRGAEGLRMALNALCRKAEEAVDDKVNYIILTDREADTQHAAIPSLLALSAIHHHLISVQKRVQTALIVESGEVREVEHAALLLGYGASAICPYMAFAVLAAQAQSQAVYEMMEQNYIHAIGKGLLKILSKMGISTIRSYRGAKLFEAIGIGQELLSTYFGTSTSSIGGIGLKEIAADALARHSSAFTSTREEMLPERGLYKYKKGGIPHIWNPETIRLLQQGTRQSDFDKFLAFSAATRLFDENTGTEFSGKTSKQTTFLRDFFHLPSSHSIPLSEVEPAEEIMHRFVTGAMSFGAISQEAHEALALAMNAIGSRSNTGEGGEPEERITATQDGISLMSRTRQIASGRFGVTAQYLAIAEEIQIKVAQGAKPGEGGQLPGYKVDDMIARTRHSTPGVTLISPPPHHDIYSIEDLAQLIFDLRQINPKAFISVKLVAESGVGTIAAGVAKAGADIITISGSEGGTGASPLSSVQYAGISPEIGLSETQQTLVLNNMRQYVRLQVDGQLKTGRDVVNMALLGADEFAFGTSTLVVLGCVMCRNCHTNRCATGICTQDAVLRNKFKGNYQLLITYFRFIAEEVRLLLAQMGFHRLQEIIGRTDLVELVHGSAPLLDFHRLLHRVPTDGELCYNPEKTKDSKQTVSIGNNLNSTLLLNAQAALEKNQDVQLSYEICNTDRSVGTLLAGVIASNINTPTHGQIQVTFRGSAGQSFGAFLPEGVIFRLEGEANDYMGKGLSGGEISLLPPQGSAFHAEENVIAGNTLLYGATSGSAYINGRVGERFAVRNSGATAVVEGVGDHCCEYMTGGCVVVLGPTGRNFAAGMSGGIAYVWDPNRHFDYFCNMDMVELMLLEKETEQNELRNLLEQHVRHTGSPLAQHILAEWSDHVSEFILVKPV